jgi:uncharacterized membrane protein
MGFYMYKKRVWEIDFLRGIALILMIIFHIAWDLNEFYNFPIEYSSGYMYCVGKAAAFLFIVITGISCTFSKNNFKRAIKILLVAMGITAATFIYDNETFIIFGILHFLGISILLYPLIEKRNKVFLLLFGTIVIIAGQILLTIPMTHNFFLPFGLTSPDYYPLDYFPLLPYFGLFLYGVFLAKVFYPIKRSIFNFELPKNPISFFGKHTLVIYVLHQPIILAVLYLIFQKNIFN